ncbi:hypothetical protein HYU40_01265 [Candidatus Woesearchaeota archaeon]|nr:hypothetical protein [Candidatus Woesearchaeota archaeon]
MKGLSKEGLVFFESWVEISFFALFTIGFVLGKLLVDLAVMYLIIAAAGLITGRLVYLRRENDPLPYYGIGAAFLIGFLLGHRIGAGIIIAAIFAVAAFLSYRAHKALDFLA